MMGLRYAMLRQQLSSGHLARGGHVRGADGRPGDPGRPCRCRALDAGGWKLPDKFPDIFIVSCKIAG